MKNKYMKTTLLLLTLSLFALSSAAFATTNSANPGAPMVVGANSTANPNLTLDFSPKVAGSYIDDAATSPQWYVIATYHTGGTKTYATAQNITSIYKKTGVNFADVITSKASAEAWSTGVWSR